MSDMQWRKANGQTGEYTGPLMPLGHGIPRCMRDFGIRRAIFDLAFGYASGFPVRDIIPFAIRSLFPYRIVTVDLSTCTFCGDKRLPGLVCCDELVNDLDDTRGYD